MTAWIEVTEQDFKEKVLQSTIPALVEFGAPWCQPCKRLEPELEKLAASLAGRVQLFHVNVDECPSLTGRYGVMGVPTVVLIIAGQERERTQGLQPLSRLMNIFGRRIQEG